MSELREEGCGHIAGPFCSIQFVHYGSFSRRLSRVTSGDRKPGIAGKEINPYMVKENRFSIPLQLRIPGVFEEEL